MCVCVCGFPDIIILWLSSFALLVIILLSFFFNGGNRVKSVYVCVCVVLSGPPHLELLVFR